MPDTDLTPCPFCASPIAKNLLRCPHCAGDLDAYVRGRSPSSGGTGAGAVFGGIMAAVLVLVVLYVLLVNFL